MNARAHPEDPAAGELHLSSDGYVRLTPGTLRTLPLRHLLSELDPDQAVGPVAAGATAATIVGYTEWVSDTRPALSLGWDWRLDTVGGQILYRREGDVRSNIMLVDSHRRDFGFAATSVLLCNDVDFRPWTEAVADYITNRYARHLSNLTVTNILSNL